MLVGPEAATTKTLRPEFKRLAPPLFMRSEELIWQDPVDLSHLTYEYDHGLLQHEEEGSEARKLTSRACNMTLTLSDQQRLLAELDKCGDPLQVLRSCCQIILYQILSPGFQPRTDSNEVARFS